MQCTETSNYRYGLWKKGSYPCGKCLACRLNIRHDWAARMILEIRLKPENCFFTLTYSDEHLPDDGKLSKRHVQNFIQNWTRQNKQAPRYFIAGEYGSLNGRPHYHGIYFGEGLQLTPRPTDGRLEDTRFSKAWSKGFTDTQSIPSDSHKSNVAAYIAGYTLKGSYMGITEATPYKEWALMSRRPAIGSNMARNIAFALFTRTGAEVLARLGSAPAKFKYGGNSYVMPYRIRKMICQIADIPFKPLSETYGIDLEDMSLFEYVTKKKTLEEAQSKEQQIRQKLVLLSHKHLTHKT